MKVFLTGGTGFIGRHLIELLLARGAEVTALVRNPDKAATLEGGKVNLLYGDVFSIPPLPAGIDAVYHLAGKTRSLKAADYYTLNRDGTASLVRFLRTYPGKPTVIHLSSLAAAGPSEDGRPVRESDPAHPVTHYGRSKLQAEQEALLLRTDFPLVVVRATAIFGPWDVDFLHFFKLVSRRILPTFRKKRLLSLCYVKDLVEALYRCSQVRVPAGEVINIADPVPVTWEELGETAAAVMGKKPIRIQVPMSVLGAAAVFSELRDRMTRKPGIFNRDKFTDMKQPGWVADIEKAARLLSFRPQYELPRALRETVDWYRARKWL
jgi:dihydroflavonol-4-reductase